MNLTMYQVDAFTDRIFSGNPAAVIVTETALDEALMQSIAAENNLAETAFITGGGDGYAIRWFTPTTEVALCGHATLAAAHVFFTHLFYPLKRITFASKSGPLHVRSQQGLLTLDFPADVCESVPMDKTIEEALGVKPLELYRGRDDFMAVLPDEAAVKALRPDMSMLSTLSSRGIIATAHGETTDFVSRFFAPQSGIAEDPVTGSAHTTLAPYWSKRLKKETLSARQLSGRGGDLQCTCHGDRVDISGNAVTYLIGEITV